MTTYSIHSVARGDTLNDPYGSPRPMGRSGYVIAYEDEVQGQPGLTLAYDHVPFASMAEAEAELEYRNRED